MIEGVRRGTEVWIALEAEGRRLTVGPHMIDRDEVDVTARMLQDGGLCVLLVDAKGNPLRYVRLFAQSLAPSQGFTIRRADHTGDDGRAVLQPYSPGRYRVVARDGNKVLAEKDVVVVPGVITDVELRVM